MIHALPEGNEAKGRNGYFKVESVHTTILTGHPDGTPYHIEMFSKRVGDSAPVYLQFNRQGIECLWRALDDMLRTPRAPK